MTKEVGTLAELNVKPGDVVEWAGRQYEAYAEPKPSYTRGIWAREASGVGGWIDEGAKVCSIISRASDTPKTWGEMTDAEKGELLLAEHEGRPIEYGGLDFVHDKPKDGKWVGEYTYRIKPEPKSEAVKLCGGLYEDCGFIFEAGKPGQKSWFTHRITFDTLGGEPDLSSIRMEKIND